MQLFKRVSLGLVMSGFLFLPSVSWAGDFNGDGNEDLVWYRAEASGQGPNLDGKVLIWLMDGATILGKCEELPTVTHPLARNLAFVGDLNGDGLDDLVWTSRLRNRVEVWTMEPGCLVSRAEVGEAAGRFWTIKPGANFTPLLFPRGEE